MIARFTSEIYTYIIVSETLINLHELQSFARHSLNIKSDELYTRSMASSLSISSPIIDKVVREAAAFKRADMTLKMLKFL